MNELLLPGVAASIIIYGLLFHLILFTITLYKVSRYRMNFDRKMILAIGTLLLPIAGSLIVLTYKKK